MTVNDSEFIPTEEVRIEEIIKKADYGVTDPFICLGEDGVVYYAKTLHAGGDSLCYEWISANIAKVFNLPIPDFHIGFIPEELVEYALSDEIKSKCKPGYCFLSKCKSDSQDIAYEQLNLVDEKLKAKILLFDWSIRNIDRHIGSRGGNPNMLFNASTSEIFIIDHNNALRDGFNKYEFWNEHPFIESAKLWDEEFKSQGKILIGRSIERLREICNVMPEKWYCPHDFEDDIENLETCFNNVESILLEYLNDDFWRYWKDGSV